MSETVTPVQPTVTELREEWIAAASSLAVHVDVFLTHKKTQAGLDRLREVSDRERAAFRRYTRGAFR